MELCRTRHFWWINYLADLSDWNFLWTPPPWQAGQRHAWPSQHQPDSGIYLVPAAGYTDTNYHASPVIHVLAEQNRWYCPEWIDPSSIDHRWSPDPESPPYIYHFPVEWAWSNIGGPEYRVPGAVDHKHVNDFVARTVHNPGAWYHHCSAELPAELHRWRPNPADPPYDYVFGNQWYMAEVMPTVEWLHPNATESTPTKYVDWPRATLLPNDTLWTIPAGVDKSQIDFSWVPDPGEPPYIYQFATQHQKTGGPVYTVPGATETKYLENIEVKIQVETVPVVEIDHMDGNAGHIPNTVKKIRYFDNYRDTLIRLAKSLQGEHEFVWVCSSVCDYTDFDFTWYPEQWQQTMLHVFASDEQKFGDTFFMHVPTFAERAEKKALLEWYSVNFVPRKSVPRRPLKNIVHSADTHVDVVKHNQTLEPLTVYSIKPVTHKLPTVSLWREETKTIVPVDAAASTVIVPREATPYIKTQLYDYPHIDKTHRKTSTAQPQDIVFISYDEPEADRNWEILHNKYPQSHRVHGVAGMELALEAAANVSTTPWYWAVFAKTELAPGFDFAFVPDYMQQPKHYIFNCRNMVNRLEYGHMGMVLYNCQGIRDINQRAEFGLDYTLSFPHESIPILSCLGRFNTTPYHTWRTAFRETAKLAFFESQQQTVEGQYRLRTWLERAEGDHAEWCLRGARDGEEFFESTNGELVKLKQSFRWEWLRDYFKSRYGNLE